MALGEIPGNPPGTTYRNYREMIDAGVHCQNFVGMVGNPRTGTESIVLNGGYADDRDFGDQIVYTGFGGQDPNTKRHVRDQEWVGANAGMRTNIAHGEPVRVIRGSRGEPAYSPASGYRYDGLYAVLEAWQERSHDGPRVCRFKLVNTDASPVLPRDPAREPPPRATSTVMRVVRDTAMANRIKELYGYACQVCGERLEMPGGASYAEGAHIRPLGEPHDGPDVQSNILCLCPNHHVLLDRGSIYLTDELAVIDGIVNAPVGALAVRHPLDLTHLAHHRARFGH